MEIGFALIMLLMALTPALLAVSFGLISYEFKNRESAFGIAFLAVFTIEIFLFRLFF